MDGESSPAGSCLRGRASVLPARTRRSFCLSKGREARKLWMQCDWMTPRVRPSSSVINSRNRPTNTMKQQPMSLQLPMW
eukprot:10727585-Alexandrium_andersonii.AAC.1